MSEEFIQATLPIVTNTLMDKPIWSVEGYGATIHIDNYSQMPKETILVIDVETNGQEGEKCEIVCIGLTGTGTDVFVYFDLRPELIEYLKSVQLVGHDFIHAEAGWLEKYGITVDQLVFDTKIGMYLMDSSKKNYGLKTVLDRQWGIKYPTYTELTTDKSNIEQACIENDIWEYDKKGKQKLPKAITLDKMPKEITAQYNAADVYYTYKLWMWLREQFTMVQWNFFNSIEMPMYKLIYLMEKKGVKIDTTEGIKLHKQYKKKANEQKKLFLNLIKQYV